MTMVRRSRTWATCLVAAMATLATHASASGAAADLPSPGFSGLADFGGPGGFQALRADLERHEARQDGRRLQGLGGGCEQDGDVTACPLADLPADSVVFPGGETSCLLPGTLSGPYGFQVIPGDSDKVVVYMEGGGTCFNAASTGAFEASQISCIIDIAPVDPSSGIFNSEDDRNPFKDYTKIIALYCSGDNHVGDVDRDYLFAGFAPVAQKGIQNTQAVLDWILEQQRNGGLAPELESLVVVGESAGALGLLLWGPILVESIVAKAARVIGDSLIGILPEPVEAQIITGFQPCGILRGLAKEKCEAGTFVVEDAYADAFERFGDHVPYLFVLLKDDNIQTDFFNLVVATEPTAGGPTAFVNSAAIYARSNELLNKFLGENFASFWVGQDTFHTLTDEVEFYTASVDGINTPDTGDDNTLFRWIALAEPCTKCSGDLLPTNGLFFDLAGCDIAQVDQCAIQPDKDDVCEDGILSSCGNVCCDASCGTCGGCNCAFLDGGAENCCPSTILFNGMACVAPDDVGCVVDPGLVCAVPGSNCDD